MPDDDSRTPSLDSLFREVGAKLARERDAVPTADGQRYKSIPTVGGRCKRELGDVGDMYLVGIADAPVYASTRQGRGEDIPELLPGDVIMRTAHSGDCFGYYAVYRGGGTGRLDHDWCGYDGVGAFIGNVLDGDRGMLAGVADAVAASLNGNCDKCQGEPGRDSGGCNRCGGSGLAKDHQPDMGNAGESVLTHYWFCNGCPKDGPLGAIAVGDICPKCNRTELEARG